MKKKYASRREIPQKIAALQPFRSNTMSAIVPQGMDTDGDYISHFGQMYATDEQYKFRGRTLRYIVYSYTTPIAAVTDHDELILVDHKFSQTTSKHQSLVRGGFHGANFQEVS